jgi:hypothetical protein
VRAKAGEHGVGAGDCRLQRRRIGRGQVGGDGAHLLGEFAWIAYHCGDVVTRGNGLLKKFPADSPGRCDDREVHRSFHVAMSAYDLDDQGGRR